MELTIREAATLLGRPQRTVRAQAARGELPAIKRDGRWMIPSAALPLDERARRSLHAKADALRQAVDDALPERVKRDPGRKPRSVAGVAAFATARPVLIELRAAVAAGDDSLAQAAGELERALLALAEATHEYERDRKLRALVRARRHLGRAAGALLLTSADEPPPQPAAGWVATLEGEAVPALSGLLRWAAKLPGGAS